VGAYSAPHRPSCQHSLAGQIGEGGKEKRRVWDKGKEGGKKRGIGKR